MDEAKTTGAGAGDDCDYGLEAVLAAAAVPTPTDAEAFTNLALEEQRAFWDGFFAARPGWPKEPTPDSSGTVHLTKDEAKAAGLGAGGGFRYSAGDDESDEEEEEPAPPEPPKPHPQPAKPTTGDVEARIAAYFATPDGERKSFRETARAAGISESRMHKVASQLRDEGKIPRSEKRGAGKRKVAAYLLEHPFSSNREIARALGMSEPAVSRANKARERAKRAII